MEWAIVMMKQDGQAEMVVSRDYDEICYLFKEACRKNWAAYKVRVLEQHAAKRVKVNDERVFPTKVVAMNALA